jgi:hypothetical protein
MSADRGKVKRATRAIMKAVPDMLLGDIRQLIEEARSTVTLHSVRTCSSPRMKQ